MRKLRVMLEDCRASDLLDVINCRRESDRSSNVGRAGFESMRRFLERAFIERDAYNHFAAALPRWHGIQKLRPSVKRANSSRPTHFVSGEGKEIAAQLLYIERHVSCTLGRIDQRQRADSASFGAKLGDWIDCAKLI